MSAQPKQIARSFEKKMRRAEHPDKCKEVDTSPELSGANACLAAWHANQLPNKDMMPHRGGLNAKSPSEAF